MAQRPDLLTILWTDGAQALAAFYREVFEWDVRVDVPVYIEFAVGPAAAVGIYEREALAATLGKELASRSDPMSGVELYITPRDFEGTVARLVERDAPCLSPAAPRPWGDEVAYFADPVGNIIAVSRPAQ